MPMREELRDRFDWLLGDGSECCTTCFRAVTGLSKKQLVAYKCQVADGHVAPVEKELDAARAFRDNPQERHADAWLSWCYHNMAEPRADSKIPFDASDNVSDEPFPQSGMPALTKDPTKLDHPEKEEGLDLPMRALPPGRIVELFESAWLAPTCLPMTCLQG